tara:strand:- start:1260 stop:1484 length:225 start_codon:yes stop_codon:yes gene_type:complete
MEKAADPADLHIPALTASHQSPYTESLVRRTVIGLRLLDLVETILYLEGDVGECPRYEIVNAIRDTLNSDPLVP